jgi:hypothetical protein
MNIKYSTYTIHAAMISNQIRTLIGESISIIDSGLTAIVCTVVKSMNIIIDDSKFTQQSYTKYK